MWIVDTWYNSVILLWPFSQSEWFISIAKLQLKVESFRETHVVALGIVTFILYIKSCLWEIVLVLYGAITVDSVRMINKSVDAALIYC